MPPLPTPDAPVTSVLFICLGNICRSPLAKGVFQAMVREQGLDARFRIDSCGLGGWHAGGPADPRTIAVAMKNGLAFDHVARQIEVPEDFGSFDLLLAMDVENLRGLRNLGAPANKVRLLRSFDPDLRGVPDEQRQVPDPYYGGSNGFDLMYDMITRACRGLLEDCASRGC